MLCHDQNHWSWLTQRTKNINEFRKKRSEVRRRKGNKPWRLGAHKPAALYELFTTMPRTQTQSQIINKSHTWTLLECFSPHTQFIWNSLERSPSEPKHMAELWLLMSFSLSILTIVFDIGANVREVDWIGEKKRLLAKRFKALKLIDSRAHFINLFFPIRCHLASREWNLSCSTHFFGFGVFANLQFFHRRLILWTLLA